MKKPQRTLLAAALLTVAALAAPPSPAFAAGQDRPQYDALSADTDLVSITIGANDAELFRLPNTCVNLLPEPLGTSCEATITGPGTDRYAAARHWALYTDTAGISAGHDPCAPPADRHIQSALSLRDGFPLHPTAAGSRAFGAAVAATLTDD
ncbi:hypothetical protein [Streptomyces sp. BPSDS2]|uniref:hypothetical protein n=1 Tax=Streptomyces sp. BPSDS2 TaxID=2571021 RepID=UPI0010C1D78C|nr:hypothetical protein [Streptomyces sp. BPSDS2]